MTLFAALIIASLTQTPDQSVEKASLSVIEIHRDVSGSTTVNTNSECQQEFVLRDWKLLMPNWKPKTSAFAVDDTQIEKKTFN